VSSLLYRALLRLLPRHRRERYGDEMLAVFSDLRSAAGRAGATLLFMKEVRGLARFALRERLGGRQRHRRDGPRWHLSSEFRWAWRGLRARGGRAVLVVGLLAGALTANTLLFSVADALVFHRLPYPDAERLVEFRGESEGRSTSIRLPVDLFESWSRRPDLFSVLHGWVTAPEAFVRGGDQPLMAQQVFVTPGLIEMLGASPRWGRGLTASDATQRLTRVTLISEELARERFGDPALAVGQSVNTDDEPLYIVGVMAGGFAFPDQRVRVWRPLDLVHADGVSPIGKLADGVDLDRLAAFAAMLPADRQSVIGLPPGWRLQPTYLTAGDVAVDTQRLMLLLFGAGICLLLAASANVVGLEISSSLGRARTHAIQLALGASRGSLMRIAWIEGAILVTVAAVATIAMTQWAAGLVRVWVPELLTRWSANRIDVDTRSILFLIASTAVVWLAAVVPTSLFARKAGVGELLKSTGSSAGMSRAWRRARSGLTIAEVSVAVALLAVGTLYARSYLGLLNLDKGFDATGLAEIDFTLPPNAYGVPGAYLSLTEQVIARLDAHPDVIAFTRLFSSPFVDGTMTGGRPEVDGGAPSADSITVHPRIVADGFLETLGFELARGRWVRPGDLSTDVVITDPLARRLWGVADPVGRQFRLGPTRPWNTVVGVLHDVRYTSDTPDGNRSHEWYPVYSFVQPPAPRRTTARPAAPAPVVRPNIPRGGASFMFLTFAARVRAGTGLGDLVQDIRAIDSGFRLSVNWVAGKYARPFQDRLLASRIVGGFSGIALLIAVAGIYGVMALLVAERHREIGIRMALGADRRDVMRLVLRSSLRLAVAGTAIGIGLAVIASRAIASQLFGVTGTDPGTYTTVAVVLVAISAVAAWRPARQAARVDPAMTLRAE
jgi:putative ABC transport system permease protein